MNDDPIDFSLLDPSDDSANYERQIHRLVSGASMELARRRARQSIWGQLFAWRRPVLAVAVVLMIAVIGAAGLADSSASRAASTDDLSTALGVPETMAQWMASDTLPSSADVLFPAEVNE